MYSPTANFLWYNTHMHDKHKSYITIAVRVVRTYYNYGVYIIWPGLDCNLVGLLAQLRHMHMKYLHSDVMCLAYLNVWGLCDDTVMIVLLCPVLSIV